MGGFSDAPGIPHVVSATMGTDQDIPPATRQAYLEAHARGVTKRHREVADLLLERLLVEGLEHRLQLEDIEALCATGTTPRGRSPQLMRMVMIELALVLRDERAQT